MQRFARVFALGVRYNSCRGLATDANAAKCKRTSLYDFHVKHNGKMVPFAGYLMPVSYAGESTIESHMHTRTKVSVFDVSHMLQFHVHGKDRIKFFESLVVSDLQVLKSNQGTLTLFTNEQGGIIDDLIVTNTDKGHLYVVSNAACADKDLEHIQSKLQEFRTKHSADVAIEVLEDYSLIAVQGPLMAHVLQPLMDYVDFKKLPFMTSTLTNLSEFGICRVTRCGYTGEDGVEISVPSKTAQELAECILAARIDGESVVKLAGLGVRDSLRLEAGLCLYGNDIDDTTTPVEAGLLWTIGKRRRELPDFPGADIILSEIKNKPRRKRVGIISSGRPSRQGSVILDTDGAEVGKVTSGCPSPSLSTNIAMGYVPTHLSKVGTEIKLKIGKQIESGKIVKMPFVKTNYFNLSV